jgi:hypothetical protein
MRVLPSALIRGLAVGGLALAPLAMTSSSASAETPKPTRTSDFGNPGPLSKANLTQYLDECAERLRVDGNYGNLATDCAAAKKLAAGAPQLAPTTPAVELPRSVPTGEGPADSGFDLGAAGLVGAGILGAGALVLVYRKSARQH